MPTPLEFSCFEEPVMSSSQISWFHPAAQMVVDFARPQIAAWPAREALPSGDVDWKGAQECAIRMGVFPLFAQRILAIDRSFEPSRNAGMPLDVHRQWRERLHRHSALALVLVNENERLLSLFLAEGIDILPVKGPTLAQRIYGNPLLREYVDLDYVVPWSDLERACGVLDHAGFTPELGGPKSAEFRAQLARMDHHTEIRYLREVAGITVIVELHWDVFPEGDPHERPSDWRAETHALYLALHGSKHLWQPLKYLCDYRDWVACHAPAFDWTWYFELARRQKLCLVAWAAPLLIAALSLDARSSWPSGSGLKGRAPSPELLRFVQEQSDPRNNLWNFHLQRMGLHDSHAQRWDYLLRLLKPRAESPWNHRARRLLKSIPERNKPH
jgi:hypothetical protein